MKYTIERRNHSFPVGLYLAVNAVSDMYLFLDGCLCVYKSLERIDKNHDYFSHLFSKEGHHKIHSANVNPTNIDCDRSQELVQVIEKMYNSEKVNLLLVSSIPIAQITGTQYDMLIKKVSKDIIYIPYDMDQDWTDAYTLVMEKIAESIPLTKKRKKKDSLGIVGYFFDRNEGDHTGNISEITLIMKEIGIDVVSVWFQGKDVQALKEIEKASVIVSLPYAGNAAEIIQKKTGADIISTGLPLGFNNTKQWIMKIARAFGKEDTARKVIEKEFRSVMPTMKWISEYFFFKKKAALVGDVYTVDYLTSALQEIGVSTEVAVIYGKKKDALKNRDKVPLISYQDDPVSKVKNLDFVIGNSGAKMLFRGVTHIEQGYPSYGTHFLYNCPYMGIKGFYILVNRIVNALLAHDIDQKNILQKQLEDARNDG